MGLMKKLLGFFVNAFTAGVKVGILGFVLMMAAAVGVATWSHYSGTVQNTLEDLQMKWKALRAR